VFRCRGASTLLEAREGVHCRVLGLGGIPSDTATQ